MAKKSANPGRILFTKQMKKEYKILAPQMLDIHFRLFEPIFKSEGYDLEVLRTEGPDIVDQGLRHVHNDICYPALLIIGQLIAALKSGKYDVNKTALFITQTGGGCRASNYIHLIRKALKNANLEFIPVISINVGNMEPNPGFKLTLSILKKMNAAMLYGDLLMSGRNQKEGKEKIAGTTDAVIEKWINILSEDLYKKKPPKKKQVEGRFYQIIEDLDKIETIEKDLIKVGIVGEIYVKFAPLGNNNLEKFLSSQGAEIVMPGLYNFIIFKLDVKIIDRELYYKKPLQKFFLKVVLKFLLKWQDKLNKAIASSKTLYPQASYIHLKELAKPYAGAGNKMGEGWLLIAEMLELIEMGAGNIICAQPFGCLPNHIIGKGVIKKIHENHPSANIVPIDYDPGASRVNQENRIKLMLASSRRKRENEKLSDL